MPGVPADKIVYDNPYSKQMLAMEPDAFKANANMFAEAMTNTQEKKATLVQWILDADRQTYVNGYTDLLRTDVRPDLTKIKAKSLVIAASFPDKAMVIANMEKQYANLQNKEIIVADNSRHFVMFDQPDWFYQQVNTFLKK
jgi:pimeloyl-ACP methyl ester carboxylesterase